MGLRGIVYTEVEVFGPTQDVHSGLFGGIVHNPNQLLVNALAGLIDAEGHIAVPSFYEGVQPLSAREKCLYAALAVDEDAYCRTLGVPSLEGEQEYSVLERRWTRPTLDINLLSGGSPRTVIPAVARAAISCRLVPDQNPEHIQAALEGHIRARLPAGTRVEFKNQHCSPAYYLDLDHPLVEPALEAMRKGFGVEPVFTREGGSIPIVVDIAAATGAPVLLIGSRANHRQLARPQRALFHARLSLRHPHFGRALMRVGASISARNIVPPPCTRRGTTRVSLPRPSNPFQKPRLHCGCRFF